MARNVVVFVGPGLVAFEQVCAVLRRRGLETHWVGYPYSLPRRLRSRLFTTTHTAHDVDSLVAVLDDIGPSRILDIFGSEFVFADVAAAAARLPLAEDLSREMARRAHWLDKQVTMDGLAAAHIPVPRQSHSHDPAVVVAELGLPVVVKGRVANGGVSVRVCHDEQQVAAAMIELEKDGGVYCEEFCSGEDGLCYAACYRPDGTILVEGAYRGVRSAASQAELGELGPLDELVTLDDAELFDIGRRVVATIGGVGLVNLDAIRTADGLRVVDVNQRPWGSVVALKNSGGTFVSGLLAAHREEPFPYQRVPAGRRVSVFSTTAINAGFMSPAAGVKQFIRDARDMAPWTGWGYIVAEWLRGTAVEARYWLGRRATGGVG